MKTTLIFLILSMIGSCCRAFGLVEDFNVPHQVAGVIEGNVILNTDVKAPPRVEVVEKGEPETKPVETQVSKASPDLSAMETVDFGKFKIPADYRSIKILGAGVVSREQALKYLRKTSSGQVRLNCSLEDIVDYYYEEAEREGVRPDLALCQAIIETGRFCFMGTVRPDQNNFCGLGSTDDGVHGAKFSTAREGVRAHIQHLLAYCRKEQPKTRIVDPRYDLAHRIRMSSGMVTNWYGLTGTWATDRNYCEKIMVLYYAMLSLR